MSYILLKGLLDLKRNKIHSLFLLQCRIKIKKKIYEVVFACIVFSPLF